MADNEGYTPQTAPLGTADDAAIAHEHGRKPPAPRKSATAVAPLTTADIAPKKAKGAKKAAKKKGR